MWSKWDVSAWAGGRVAGERVHSRVDSSLAPNTRFSSATELERRARSALRPAASRHASCGRSSVLSASVEALPSPFGLRGSAGRTILTAMCVPGIGNSRWISSIELSCASPSPISMSPGRMPARAAGPPGTTVTACTATGASNRWARWKKRVAGKSWQPSPK
eukprot:scaffold8366_cov121-Isochrysis_galbana.AAC.4